jgi:GTP-binding protein LepA
VFTPASTPRESLQAGEVGFIIAGIKELQAAKVGDTVTLEKKLPNNAGSATEALPGFKEIQPQVFAGLYPTEASEYDSAARRAGEAQAQRRLAALRARGEPGARLRLPLRLPRPAAHGDRAGAAGARVRPGPDHHRAQRRLPGAAGDGEVLMVENPSKMPDQAASRRSASRSSRCTCTCRRNTSAR